MQHPKILLILGTRPEAIKFAPLYKALKGCGEFEVEMCATGQHKELLYNTLNFFEITPDYNLDLMEVNQTLSGLTSKGMKAIQEVVDNTKPHLIFVQGDTTTAFMGGLVGFYNKIPVAHLEAGLRSGNKFSPFPEEINRVYIGKVADYHFAPTQAAVKNLEKEGITEQVYNVGNSVIDALLYASDKLRNTEGYVPETLIGIDPSKKILLVTSHRRENFGAPQEGLCDVLIDFIERYSDVQVVFSVHPNPNVVSVVERKLKGKERIILSKPLDYMELVWVMDKSHIIVTDSGGIQEEAPSLGKPVLVFRNETERMEGVEAGTAVLTGNKKDVVWSELVKLMDDEDYYSSFTNATNPYGDGKTSERIVELLKKNILK